jgi:nucleotide-binding universal stress UspA family protein
VIVYRSILVAVDGSASSDAALDEAIALARDDGARLTVMTVAVPTRLIFASPYVAPVPTGHELEQTAEQIVARAASRVPDDVPVATVVRRGPPAKAILERVENGEHDLVVRGSRGLGGLGMLVLGSVSRDVLAHSPVPVHLVRAGLTAHTA